MNSPLKSALRVHFVEVIVIAMMMGIMVARWPWPARVPVHFDGHWRANRWGPAWEVGLFPALALMVFLAGVWVSVLWAREEKGRKRFNYVLPVIAIPFGAMAGVHFWIWWNLPALARTNHAAGGWIWVLVGAAIVCDVEVPLELLRRAIPVARGMEEQKPVAISAADVAAEREVRRQIPRHGKWIYRCRQSQFWISWLMVTVGIAMGVGGALLVMSHARRLLGTPFVCVSAVMFLLAAILGSMTVIVTREHLIVRMGIFGIRLLRLPISKISQVRVDSFRPIREFGGWGIRVRGNTTAFLITGRRGVRIDTHKGREYVIGADQPELLAAAIRLVSGKSSAETNVSQ